MGGEYLHAVEIGISLQERCLNEMVAVVLNRRNFLSINVPDSLGVGRVERVILRCGALVSGNVSWSQFNRYEPSSEMWFLDETTAKSSLRRAKAWVCGSEFAAVSRSVIAVENASYSGP